MLTLFIQVLNTKRMLWMTARSGSLERVFYSYINVLNLKGIQSIVFGKHILSKARFNVIGYK